MNPNSSEARLIDRLISHLNVPQKLYRPISPLPAELHQYPVEFDYLARILHRLGDDFFGYKIADPDIPKLGNAVLYSILGPTEHLKHGQKYFKYICQWTPQQICNQLKINILLIGPDEQQVQIINSDPNSQGYVMLYRSYEDWFYPIISLEDAIKPSLFYWHNNSILQKLVPKLT